MSEQADAGATDGGAGLHHVFDVTQASAVVKAEAAMEQASDGLRAWLPPDWLTPSWLGLERWQWLGVPLLAALLFGAAVLVSRLTAAVLLRVASRTSTGTDDRIVQRLHGPLRLWWAALLTRIGVPLLALPAGAEALVRRGAKVTLGLAVFWGLLRALNAWSEHFGTSTFAQARPGSRALVGLFARVARFALVALAVLATLSELGYQVTSLLAGLGIGGLALALGAQKTLENVFGAFAIAVDQPFREGDFVKVEDVLGHVESIGLRSTRLRTLDRTLVTIPNGKLSDLRVETFAARDRIRLHATVGLLYSTTADQLRQVLEGFQRVLRAQPKLWPEIVEVQLTKLGESSLDVEVMAWFVLTDFGEFKRIREEVLLGWMEVVEQAGTGFAYPTRTVHLAGGASAAGNTKPPKG